jgi:hypothetical protein
MTIEELIKLAEDREFGGVAFWEGTKKDTYLCCLLDNMFKQVKGSVPWNAKSSIDECVTYLYDMINKISPARRDESPSC